MKYRSPDLDKMSRDEIIEALKELNEFGVCLKPVLYRNLESFRLLTILQCVQDSYKTAKVQLYTIDDISFSCAEIVVMYIPEVNKAFWQNFNEFSECDIKENILLTRHWKETPEKVYQSLVECDCLKPYSVLSDDTFNDITDFTVHYRLEDLQSR